jgi:phenylalanyl-tRNA synthetase alpha chain
MTDTVLSYEDLHAEIARTPLDTEAALEAFKVLYLSKKQGRITDLLKRIPLLPPDQRKVFGQQVNLLKEQAEARYAEAEAALRRARRATRHQAVDLTLPGRRPPVGSLHPLTQTLLDIRRVFERFGFDVAEGPEIEDAWHNFTALNFPPDHPARDMQDTFFLEKPELSDAGVLLRTHTSPVQVRVMQAQQPPIRIIAPGRVYRNEAISYKSFCLFHQVEGLYVDEGVSFADLKGMLQTFARAMFGEAVRTRLRPSFFPFTETSAEMDIWWPDPSKPEGGRWLEILGSGMVDPAVFEAVGIDPERYTGYAFGMGVERIAMLRYGIDDIRILYENDVRFLEQF